MRKALILMLLIMLVSVPLAAAHPFTEKTIPSLESNAPAGTTEVIVFFTEAVDVNFSEIRVFDNEGNHIDNRDTDYYEGEMSLIVTTPPLEDGVYTVTTKVLSKVDGHLVPWAFLFGVGDAVIDPSLTGQEAEYDLIFFPNAGARFPGQVGQTVVLGAVIASLLIWGTQNKGMIRSEIERIEESHRRRFMSITKIGLILIFASDILIITMQSVTLNTSPLSVIGTYFGIVWLSRVIITLSLLGIWLVMSRKTGQFRKWSIPMLAVSLVLIGTTTMVSHGAATGQAGAIILDYVHNLVAAVWIGGIIYLGFVLLPALSGLGDAARERMSLVLIPRFSIAFVITLGIVIVTGPTLMWFLDSDVGAITASVFGQLIIAKIAIASVMVGLGGYIQIGVQRSAERKLSSGRISIHKRMRRSLKVDAALGIALLGIVALLTNGTLPSAEIQPVDAQETVYGFSTTMFSENARFDTEILPFASGANTITMTVSGLDGLPLRDSDQVRVKISNPSKSISPIEVPMTRTVQDEGPDRYSGEVTFGFSGEWRMEVEAIRTEEASESTGTDLLVKPRLSNIQAKIIEYELPEDAKPLYPLFDGGDSLWISDPSAPRLWEFDLESKEFAPYTFDGVTTTFLTQDSAGNIWFVDTPGNQIGFVDADTREITTRTIPKLDPLISDNTPLSIQADFDDNVWITIVNKDKILRYDPETDEFEEFKVPGTQMLPFALTIDGDGKVWFSTSNAGTIGYIDPDTGNMTQFGSDPALQAPEAMIFDDDGNLWVTEHTGLAVQKFDPVLETFERFPVPDAESLPFGMTFDRYDNLWIAMHTTDNLGIYDPHNNDLIEIPVPSQTSFVQFMASDGGGNVWFVEQQANKIGTVQITEIPVSAAHTEPAADYDIRYAELASPLIAMGIIAVSIFYVKSVEDKRRLNELLGQQSGRLETHGSPKESGRLETHGSPKESD